MYKPPTEVKPEQLDGSMQTDKKTGKFQVMLISGENNMKTNQWTMIMANSTHNCHT